MALRTCRGIVFTWLVFVMAGATPAQESDREDFERFCDALQGRWIGEVVWVTDWPGYGSKGDSVTAYAELVRTLDGNAIVLKFYGGAGSATGLIVYDAGSKQIKELSTSTGGTVREVVHEINGRKWTRRVKGSNPDGARVEGLLTIEISEDGNTHRWSGHLTIDGERTDEVRDVWRRLSD